MLSHPEIHPTPTHLYNEQDMNDEKKGADVDRGVAEVQPVELENGGLSKVHCIYENIPEGIDP